MKSGFDDRLVSGDAERVSRQGGPEIRRRNPYWTLADDRSIMVLAITLRQTDPAEITQSMEDSDGSTIWFDRSGRVGSSTAVDCVAMPVRI